METFQIFLFKTSLGKGGNAGRVSIHYRELNGQVQLRSCRGTGAEAAVNGAGGQGKRNLI